MRAPAPAHSCACCSLHIYREARLRKQLRRVDMSREHHQHEKQSLYCCCVAGVEYRERGRDDQDRSEGDCGPHARRCLPSSRTVCCRPTSAAATLCGGCCGALWPRGACWASRSRSFRALRKWRLTCRATCDPQVCTHYFTGPSCSAEDVHLDQAVCAVAVFLDRRCCIGWHRMCACVHHNT